MKIVAVDFDDTLVYEKYGLVYPMPGAREALESMRAAGLHIVIHTCRTGLAFEAGQLEEELQFIEETLNDFGIPYDEIYAGPKMVADCYIDDRAIRFRGDWQEVVSELHKKRRRRIA